jgi:hypothetical protein
VPIADITNRFALKKKDRLSAVSPKFDQLFGQIASAGVFFLRRASKPNAPRPVRKSGSAPGSGTALVPGTKKSGPVPKENVAPVIVVADVTPERARRTVSDPTVKGLN